MKKLIKISVLLCCVIFTSTSLFISCKFIEENSLSDEKVAQPITSADDQLMAKQEEHIESVENTDTLTAIFNENESENIAENGSNNNSVVVLTKEKSNSNKTKIVDNYSNSANTNVAKVNSTENSVEKNVGTKIVTPSKESKKIVVKKAKVVKTKPVEKEETDEERNYRLQKANHTIPNL